MKKFRLHEESINGYFNTRDFDTLADVSEYIIGEVYEELLSQDGCTHEDENGNVVLDDDIVLESFIEFYEDILLDNLRCFNFDNEDDGVWRDYLGDTHYKVWIETDNT